MKKVTFERRFYSQREKLDHYDGVSKGEIPVKANSKFSKEEQIAYAKGQANARKENNAIYAIKMKAEEDKKKNKK